MNEPIQHAQFQYLSACEAIQMQKLIGYKILQAYEDGMNTVMQNYDKPIENLIAANKNALINLGFSNSDTLANSLIRSLHIAVKAEEQGHE